MSETVKNGPCEILEKFKDQQRVVNTYDSPKYKLSNPCIDFEMIEKVINMAEDRVMYSKLSRKMRRDQ